MRALILLSMIPFVHACFLHDYPYTRFATDLCESRCNKMVACEVLDPSLEAECDEGCQEAIVGNTCPGYDPEKAQECITDFARLSCEEFDVSDPASCEWACTEGAPEWAP